MQTNRKKSRTGPKSAEEAVAGKDSFESVAKRLECDEDKARFEAKLGKLAKTVSPKKGSR
jgi:hypothetical protein